jgi:hypothetical protein
MKNAVFWDVSPCGSYIFADFCHPDDEGDTFLPNVGSYKKSNLAGNFVSMATHLMDSYIRGPRLERRLTRESFVVILRFQTK